MQNLNKPNDWFLAINENQSFSYDDFKAQGITVDNTALRSKDVYKNSEDVQQMFTDEDGNFN
jgi:glycerophosphoryl diester phosphodiesterase